MARRRHRRHIIAVIVSAATLAGAASCGSGTQPLPIALTRSTVEWETYDYELSRFGSVLADSFDGLQRSVRSFDSIVLANEFLEVTLVPEFGGRILSIVYLPTGHEQLYQNPIGVPYQIGTGVFYYDWLMVWGGIFPTFPAPEHGKAWFLPWEVEIVEESDEMVTVAMTFIDDDDHPFAPPQYDGDATGLEVTFAVSLRAGRSALDTNVTISNPGDETVEYEYWTNLTLAPGSTPGDTRATAATEIITPVEQIQIPGYWEAIAAQEDPTGLFEVHRFDELRRFGNWNDRGIAYAFPNTRAANFWGVINHDEGEGLFRVADNTITPGLKLWTWGYEQSIEADPVASPIEERPYVELWAGVSPQFFMTTDLGARERVTFDETYGPSLGLENVTHASDELLADVNVEGGRIGVEVFGFTPGREVEVRLDSDGATFHSATVSFDPVDTVTIEADLPDPDDEHVVDVSITDADEVLLEARIESMGG